MVKNILFVIVFVSPPFLKKYLLRWFGNATIGRHVHIGWFSTVMGKEISLADHSQICALTVMRCYGNVSLGKYAMVSSFNLVYGSSNFHLGNHSYVGPQCLINVEEPVHIGNYSALGPRTMIYTHGAFLPCNEGYWAKFAPVTIGENVWIAAGVFIHPGVKVGDHAFVNSMSVLKQEVSPGTIMDGYSAQNVNSMTKVKLDMTPGRVDALVRRILRHFAEVILTRKLNIVVQSDSPDCLRFLYRRKGYVVGCIPNNEGSFRENRFTDCERLILIVNHKDWSLPFLSSSPMTFDLTTMCISGSRDRVGMELNNFMRSYYGIKFEYQE